jgi:hypothetical protein
VSYLSELDPDGWQQRDTEDLLTRDATPEEGPGFFRGIVKAPLQGFARGLTNLNDALLTATDLVVPMTDEERGQQQAIKAKLTDLFTPDARTVGTAGRVLGGVTQGIAPLVVPEVGVPLMVGSNTLAAGKEPPSIRASTRRPPAASPRSRARQATPASSSPSSARRSRSGLQRAPSATSPSAPAAPRRSTRCSTRAATRSSPRTTTRSTSRRAPSTCCRASRSAACITS